MPFVMRLSLLTVLLRDNCNCSRVRGLEMKPKVLKLLCSSNSVVLTALDRKAFGVI